VGYLDGAFVNLIWGEQNESGPNARSRGRDGPPPLVRRLGSEDPERRPRHEMALKVEVIVDGNMHAEEALAESSRLEVLYLALASSHRLCEFSARLFRVP
jgi:hypothetical protein